MDDPRPRSQRLSDASHDVAAAAGRYVDAAAKDGVPRATERLAFERLAEAVAKWREVR